MLLNASSNSNLGFIYESRNALVLLGMFFFASGLTLFIGKIAKIRRIQGYGLFMIYSCFLFACLINWLGYGFDRAWFNMTGALITGALYLRWKYHIYIYEPPVDKVRAKMLE